MPTYNSAEYLERTLGSLSQMLSTDKEMAEVLFVDDGSTDRTLEILERVATKDPDTYRLLKAKHGGVSKARNLGIKNATGEYITFVDSDDAYAKNFIPTFVQQTKNSPDLVWEDMHELAQPRSYQISTLDERLELMSMVLGLTKPFIQEGIASKFYRREFLLENKLEFDEEIVVSEDTLFILEAIDKAQSAYLSDLKFYQILEEHSLSRFNEKVLVSELEYEKRIDSLLKIYPNTQTKNLLRTRVKLNGLCTLIRRYYGAKIIRKELSIWRANLQLKEVAKENNYKYLVIHRVRILHLPLRYSVLSILLNGKLYVLALYFDVFVDRLRKVKWK